MSTKNTIVTGSNFHLFEQLFDERAVYLQLEKADFECNRSHITIRISNEIWEKIRQYQCPLLRDYGFLENATDEEILELAKKEVFSSAPIKKKTPAFSGESILQDTVEHYKTLRSMVQAVKQKSL